MDLTLSIAVMVLQVILGVRVLKLVLLRIDSKLGSIDVDFDKEYKRSVEPKIDDLLKELELESEDSSSTTKNTPIETVKVETSGSLITVTILFTIVYSLVITFRHFIYDLSITNGLLVTSISINIAFLLTGVVSKLKATIRGKGLKVVLQLLLGVSYTVTVLGFGVYYIYFLIKLASSGLLI